MKESAVYNDHQEFVLGSENGVPFNFTITIREAEGKKKQCFFDIAGQNIRGLKKVCSYTLPDREHHSYLDFFATLSAIFGLRVPQNRHKNTPVQSSFKISYNEVLTSNLDSDIYYGYGDPSVIRVDKNSKTSYYLLATSNDAPQSFPLLRSSNLKDWELVNFIFPEGKKPKWAADGELISDYWAAEMHQVGNQFMIYYVAREALTSELCIGMAVSSSPEGPFISGEAPVLKGNIIDPHIFVGDESVYLYWKEDNNDIWPGKLIELLYNQPYLISILFDKEEDRITAAFMQTLWPWIKTLHPMERFLVMQVLIEGVISSFASFYNRLTKLLKTEPDDLHEEIGSVLQYMKTPMYAQELSKDGVSLIGERTKILENDLEWEAHLVEGMWVTQHQDTYYLFYAGNDFSTDQYGIGVAIAKTPLGPYTKMQEPFLRSTPEWWAPGHPSVVIDTEGKHHMFLHAYFPGKAGYKEFRALLSVPLIFGDRRVTVG